MSMTSYSMPFGRPVPLFQSFGTADQLFFDQMEATWLGAEQLVAQARANPIENFRLVFADAFLKANRLK